MRPGGKKRAGPGLAAVAKSQSARRGITIGPARNQRWGSPALTLADRAWTCPACGTTHDRDENAGTNLARLPASQAEAQSDRKAGPARHVAVKRVNHLGKVAA